MTEHHDTVLPFADPDDEETLHDPDDEETLYGPDDEETLDRFRLTSFNARSYLNRYGFDDGDQVLEEERPFCKQEASKLASLLKEHLTDWEPVVVETGHNPYYVSFRNPATGKLVSYYNMGERMRRRMDRIIDKVIKLK